MRFSIRALPLCKSGSENVFLLYLPEFAGFWCFSELLKSFAQNLEGGKGMIVPFFPTFNQLLPHPGSSFGAWLVAFSRSILSTSADRAPP